VTRIGLRRFAVAPVVLWSQDAQRHRRQHWLHVELDQRFDLAAEVDAIVSPLAVEVAALRAVWSRMCATGCAGCCRW
jgi:hypothetical protein